MKTWHPEEGRGSIEIDGTAGERFAHFSCIVQKEHEFPEPAPGEQVLVSWHEAQQDNFPIVPDRVKRSGEARQQRPDPRRLLIPAAPPAVQTTAMTMLPPRP